MGNEAAEKPPSTPAPPAPSTAQTLGSDALTMGASLPFIGPIFAAFGKLSSKGKGIAVLVVTLLVVYPLVSLAMALLIISKSPSSIKSSARNFIMSSIGAEDEMKAEMMEGVNSSNKVIDASIPRQFTLGSSEDAIQRVNAGQLISFEVFLRKTHIDGGPECAIEQSMPDDSLARMSVRSLNSDADPWSRDIGSDFNQLNPIGTFGDADWKRFQDESKTGTPQPQHLLKIKLTENPDLAGNAFLKCNRISVDVYMNIFKPQLVRSSS